jgi:hypothetical protein
VPVVDQLFFLISIMASLKDKPARPLKKARLVVKTEKVSKKDYYASSSSSGIQKKASSSSSAESKPSTPVKKPKARASQSARPNTICDPKERITFSNPKVKRFDDVTGELLAVRQTDTNKKQGEFVGYQRVKLLEIFQARLHYSKAECLMPHGAVDYLLEALWNIDPQHKVGDKIDADLENSEQANETEMPVYWHLEAICDALDKHYGDDQRDYLVYIKVAPHQQKLLVEALAKVDESETFDEEEEEYDDYDEKAEYIKYDAKDLTMKLYDVDWKQLQEMLLRPMEWDCIKCELPVMALARLISNLKENRAPENLVERLQSRFYGAVKFNNPKAITFARCADIERAIRDTNNNKTFSFELNVYLPDAAVAIYNGD